MTTTPTRPADPATGSLDLPGDLASLRREVHVVQALIVVLAAAVTVLELTSDTTPGFFAVMTLPFVLLGLAAYGLALTPAVTVSWLPIAPVVLAAGAAGGVFAAWQPWYWSAAYCAGLVPAVTAAVVARLA